MDSLNIDIEKQVLAFLIINTDRIPRYINAIVPEDFLDTRNRKIFKTIDILFETSKPIGLAEIYDFLQGQLLGSYLYEIADHLPGVSNLLPIINKLKQQSNTKALFDIISNAQHSLASKEADFGDVLETLYDSIDELKKGEYSAGFTLQSVINWINLCPGEFSTLQLDNDLGIRSIEDKKKRTKILEFLVAEKTIERSGTRRGMYRPCQKNLNEMNFLEASLEPVPVWLPFNIHHLVALYPGNIVQVSGEKNSGKTAFLLNCVMGNMQKGFEIHYFNSEMGQEELKTRLTKFGFPLDKWKFKAYSRSSDFSDVMFHGERTINIIDFLECHTDFFRMGELMSNIHNNLDGSIAIVAVQKNKGADKGLGGNRTEEKPRLIINLEPGKLKIAMAKNWTSDVNPTGKCMNFKLAQGHRFVQQGDWYEESQM